jgi:hypothetical protein
MVFFMSPIGLADCTNKAKLQTRKSQNQMQSQYEQYLSLKLGRHGADLSADGLAELAAERGAVDDDLSATHAVAGGVDGADQRAHTSLKTDTHECMLA